MSFWPSSDNQSKASLIYYSPSRLIIDWNEQFLTRFVIHLGRLQDFFEQNHWRWYAPLIEEYNYIELLRKALPPVNLLE